MTSPPHPGPVFPGGMETAPELTPGGCAHEACLCPVEPGMRYCCLACARAGDDTDVCACGHFGCSDHAV
ncbi:MAG: hypothetical protein HY002_21935 [Candidatus Rokubacteria bacterium]|nr:hypothetical protein [Candidatus Rokubacteria bacterium]